LLSALPTYTSEPATAAADNAPPVVADQTREPFVPSKAYSLPFDAPTKTVPVPSHAGDDGTAPSVLALHTAVPSTWSYACSLPSAAPTATNPPAEIAGDESTAPPVACVHRRTRRVAAPGPSEPWPASYPSRALVW
jgi:hypothetical protein